MNHDDLVAYVKRLESRLAAAELEIAELRRAAEGPMGRHVPAARAAEALGWNVRTVRRAIEREELLGRAIRIGESRRRRWVVNAVALERLLARGDGPSAAGAARTARGAGAGARKPSG